MGMGVSFFRYALLDKMWVQARLTDGGKCPENRMQPYWTMLGIISVQLHRDSQGRCHTSIKAYRKKDTPMPQGITAGVYRASVTAGTGFEIAKMLRNVEHFFFDYGEARGLLRKRFRVLKVYENRLPAMLPKARQERSSLRTRRL
jgi:hypothetical protein